ncbi:ras and Rab interactor 3-like protein, partial [Lates japonicus]
MTPESFLLKERGDKGVGSLQQIQQKWTDMHEAYSLNKKVQILLEICKGIYQSMSANANS